MPPENTETHPLDEIVSEYHATLREIADCDRRLAELQPTVDKKVKLILKRNALRAQVQLAQTPAS
jgi:hypothetical protein